MKLKEYEETQKTVTISVRVNDQRKGMPDNLRVLELLMILKLELGGETFVLNSITIINTIFHSKGWIKADSLKR